MKNKKAFTLVELLAVIVILAVILVIAVPQVLDVIDTTKVGSLESSAKLIANSAEKKYAEFLALGKDTSTIQCSDVTKLNDKDYGTCTISFDENGKATVSIKGKDDGKFEGLKCEGTKDNMVCEDIPTLPVINCTFTPSEEDFIKVYTVKDYDACMTNLRSTIIDEMFGTEDILNGICSGTGDGYGGSTSGNIVRIIEENYFTEKELIDLNIVYVTEELAELKTGTQYVHGQYTYTYKMALSGEYNHSTYIDGWSVTLTNKESTEPVTSEVCTYINDIPVTIASNMFYQSKAETIDLSKFNSSNIIDMNHMFAYSKAININFGDFDTSNVTEMYGMFRGSKSTSLDLSSFDTSKVTDMSTMFYHSAATSLDLSSFDTSNVTGMYGMFSGASATTGYARTQADADKFNSSSNKPSTLTFVVK